ncbi:antagonist of KipI [Chitinophaga ginsengisegetis]|uniref:Antagonist of KipI n=1 Tax=Chitinophaga ginsengisegetis TaxID=393003 RepID=A0A1T5N489_9BACT|nr:biotin-dependent carboxyltransferase family protein [Chitinophaga ginsengisegetis]MDR6571138.1 antagonist of KipI [Chitinophaga ginsengisegetis]MDR6650872.1 antagonist of KipI [Chitinophaga ginsengisegetis]MDR6657241.1 antagonist of KipI [Chitinophaga ginsengisegetis]SKC95311.1 antagonist of KipI [Chitinophaga ginsengisegetis]
MIQVVQQGLLDTIQDAGRYGYQHLGINPGGAMDRVALAVANSLVGNDLTEAAIELHFPASAFLFDTDAMIALSGADFGAIVNGQPLDINRPVLVNKQTVLRFSKPVSGARCYLAIRGGLALTPWLGSYSTHLKAGAGGLDGRPLKKNDHLQLRQDNISPLWFRGREVVPLRWTADVSHLYTTKDIIRTLPGSQWSLLREDARQQFTAAAFSLTEQSDRMGFRLSGPPLATQPREEQLSAGITRGTIQLLPDGQLIILMADHQTTGGYARLAHVITADMPSLSQRMPYQEIHFSMTDEKTASALLWKQEQDLLFLQNACKLRLEEWLQQQPV